MQWLRRVTMLMILVASARADDASLQQLSALEKQFRAQFNAGKYLEAEPIAREMLELAERNFITDRPAIVAVCLSHLASVYAEQSRYAEALQLQKQALVLLKRVHGPEHPAVAVTLSNLAQLAGKDGRYEEAMDLHLQALSIYQKKLGAEHRYAAMALSDMSLVAKEQGRFSEAERLQRKAMAIREKLGPNHPDWGASLQNLALIYERQGRYEEAQKLHERALAIAERAHGPDHPSLAGNLNDLANTYVLQRRFKEAQAQYQRALKILETKLGPEHSLVAQVLGNLSSVAACEKQWPAAENYSKRALAIFEKKYGADHPDVAVAWMNLAMIARNQNRYADAATLVDRAAAIQKKFGVSPQDQFVALSIQADVAWHDGRKEEAVAALESALTKAELQRGLGSGSAIDRAQLFAEFAFAFERMVDWRTELGDVRQAYLAAERFRSRSLLDQMQASGDPLAGVPAQEADRLRAAFRTARARLTQWESRLSLLAESESSDSDREGRRKALLAERDQAQEAAIDAYRAIENAGATARVGSGVNGQARSLEDLSAWSRRTGGLVLDFFLGEKGGWLVVVSSAGQTARIVRLQVSAKEAQALGVDAGPLTAERLRGALVNDQQTGVVQLLADPERMNEAGVRGIASTSSSQSTLDARKLAVLADVLIPPAEREALAADKFRRLIVIPDGPLSMLPFEVLVVEGGAERKRLLDVNTPIQYAPSATILLNLAERTKTQPAPDRQPVLTIGNPVYRDGGASTDPYAAVPRGRYRSSGGKLTPLKFSDNECRWIFDTFQKVDKPVGRLLQADATEAAVRQWSGGREILHFACHGLVDQRYGNLFGALALTAGPDPSNPDDDGELQLGEIFGLNLQGTELAILSACETNLGPDQKGEGLLALSRGFLVAGARRVAASNWLVDDEAAATLVTLYCSGIAQAEKSGRAPDHAALLQSAKRRVRADTRWKAPYFWAPMVLVGPE